MRALALAGLLALSVLAGCLTGRGPADTQGGSAHQGGPWLDLAELPQRGASGLEQVAYVPVAPGAQDALPAQMIVNLALAKDTLLASLGSYGGDLVPGMSLAVFDVSTSTAPVLRSVTPFAGGGVESVAISDDARWAFLGTEFTGAVGIWAVDLADPSHPVPTGFTPVPTEGPHTLRYAEVGGHHLVFSAVAHVATALNAAGMPQDPIPGPPDLRVDIFEFDPGRPQTPMTLLSSYHATDEDGVADSDGGIPIVHDTFLQVHPITHQPILYVSHWDRGVRLLDLSDPSNPKEIGKYTTVAPAEFLATHTTIPDDGLVDGRHYTVMAPICEYDPDQSCILRILDTTDPTNVTLAGTWRLPGDVHGGQYTPEILAVHAGKVYLPYTKAGVWVLDINSTVNAHAPKTQAYFLPSDTPSSGVPTGGSIPWSNSIVLKNGAIYLADTYSGLHVLRLTS